MLPSLTTLFRFVGFEQVGVLVFAVAENCSGALAILRRQLGRNKILVNDKENEISSDKLYLILYDKFPKIEGHMNLNIFLEIFNIDRKNRDIIYIIL